MLKLSTVRVLPGDRAWNLLDISPWLSNFITRSTRPNVFVELTGEKYRWQNWSLPLPKGTLACKYWPDRQPVCWEAWGKANWNCACLSPIGVTDKSSKETKFSGLRAGRCWTPSLPVKGPRVAGGLVLKGFSNSVSWYLSLSPPTIGSFNATSRINRWATSIFWSSSSFNSSAFSVLLSVECDLTKTKRRIKKEEMNVQRFSSL